MVFNKKRGALYISILLLILVGVYYVNSIGYASRNYAQTFVNTTGDNNATCPNGPACGAAYSDLLNWTRGGNRETFLVQINLSTVFSATANNNISRINITLPSGFGGAAIFGGLNNVSFPNNPTNFNWTGTAFSGYVTFFNYTYNFTNGSGYGNTLVTLGGPRGLYETVRVMFNATAINGTEQVLNWTVILYNITGLGNEALATLDSGLGLLTGIDGLAPRSNGTNVTDSTNTRTSFTSTQYLKYDNTTNTNNNTGINITIMLTDYNMDRVILAYNDTGGTLNLTAIRNNIHGGVSRLNHTSMINENSSNAKFLGSSSVTGIGLSVVGNATGLLNLDTRSRLTATSPTYQFVFNISNFAWGAADGTQFRYVFIVYDLYNQTEIINNSNGDFVLVRDVNSPSPTLTAPSDTTISLYETIKYTCSGSDTSGIASCSLKVTKSDSSTFTKTGCSEKTIGDPTSETDIAGTYTVECTTTDNVGRTASTSSTFSVSAAGGGTGGTGGGGGGGGSAGSSADNPVTVEAGVTSELGELSTSDTYTSIATDGTLSFTVSGSSHTAKVLSVTETSATIEFTSTPQQLTLNIGDTGEVDLDDDGTNDIMVTLSSIDNGMANLVFKLIEAVVPTPEEPTPTPGEVTGEEAGASTVWIWIIVIVVVILLIWYFSRKKQQV